MKNSRKQDNPASNEELYNIFKEIYSDNEECIQAINEAKRAFSFVSRDKLFRKTGE